MNRLVALIAIVAAFVLLSPYLGIHLFGGHSPGSSQRAAPQPSAVQDSTSSSTGTREKPKGRQTMVEELLSPAQTASAPKKLADIEDLLQDDGQNK